MYRFILSSIPHVHIILSGEMRKRDFPFTLRRRIIIYLTKTQLAIAASFPSSSITLVVVAGSSSSSASSTSKTRIYFSRQGGEYNHITAKFVVLSHHQLSPRSSLFKKEGWGWGWSWNLGPSVSILLRADEPRHPRVIHRVKGPPPWSKEKEEKEMRNVVHENANLAGKACCCVLSF